MTSTDIGIMARLREETAGDHKLAESSAFERALVSGRLPQAAFVEYLAQRLLVHTVLERDVCELTERDERFRSVVTPDLLQEPNLRADLAFFAVDADEVEPRGAAQRLISDFELTRAARPSALLGFYYVLEGSKNGARFIARAVRLAYGLTAGEGTRYLDPHGDQQWPLWQAFRERMDAVTFSVDEADEIVAAAGRMFRGVYELDQEIWNALCVSEEDPSAVAQSGA